MIVTDNLIYLQMRKTGCTHIASLLLNTVGGKRLGKHKRLTNYDTSKLVVGSVRNPWIWYVSLWAYGCSGRGGLRNRLTKRNYRKSRDNFVGLKFGEALAELKKPVAEWKYTYQDSERADIFREWLKLLHTPKRQKDMGEGYASSSISDFAGMMTYRYCKFYLEHFKNPNVSQGISTIDELREYNEEHNLLDDIILTKNLEEDFLRVLERAGYEVTDEIEEYVMNAKAERKNRSAHRSTEYYYDNDSIELVRRSERFIIEEYNYKAPPLS